MDLTGSVFIGDDFHLSQDEAKLNDEHSPRNEFALTFFDEDPLEPDDDWRRLRSSSTHFLGLHDSEDRNFMALPCTILRPSSQFEFATPLQKREQEERELARAIADCTSMKNLTAALQEVYQELRTQARPRKTIIGQLLETLASPASAHLSSHPSTNKGDETYIAATKVGLSPFHADCCANLKHAIDQLTSTFKQSESQTQNLGKPSTSDSKAKGEIGPEHPISRILNALTQKLNQQKAHSPMSTTVSEATYQTKKQIFDGILRGDPSLEPEGYERLCVEELSRKHKRNHSDWRPRRRCSDYSLPLKLPKFTDSFLPFTDYEN